MSPRAGATKSRGVDGAFSVSESKPGGMGVDGLGDAPADFAPSPEDALAEAGGAKRSIVNARKSSCCNFSFGRIVSNMVAMVRKVA